MYLTWFGSNSWLIELADQRILLDPWLIGPLVFGQQSWFFKAEKATSFEIPENIDLILLSQGLPDHAHPPTLEVLDKTIPVWGSPNAIKVAIKLGFQNTQTIEHRQSAQMNNLDVHSFPGSPIGPMLTENAYVLTKLSTSTSLYYEPHGFHSPELKGLGTGRIDAALIPLVNLTLPLIGDVIQGGKAALTLAQWVQPNVLIPTTVGDDDVIYSGLLNSILGMKGDLNVLRTTSQQLGLKTQILDPFPPGERVELPLSSLN